MSHLLEAGVRLIRDLSIMKFNIQYGHRIQKDHCVTRQIDAGYGCDYGFETTVGDSTALRLRVYFNISRNYRFLPYRLETDTQFIEGAVGDEIFVMIWTLSPALIDNGLVAFTRFDTLGDPLKNIQFVEGEGLEFVSGDPMAFLRP